MSDAPAAPAPPARPAMPSMLDLAGSLLGDLPGVLSDRVHLLSLELRRAGLALAHIVALVVAISILAATAWIAMWCGVAAVLIAGGLQPGAVIAIVLLLNAGGAAWAAMRVQSLSRLLGLPATVRRLTLPAPAPPAPPAPLAPVAGVNAPR